MKIRLKLFATLSRYLGKAISGTPHDVEIPDGYTLADLATWLKLPPEDVKVCFINGRIQELDAQIHDGDEVGIFPPVGGG